MMKSKSFRNFFTFLLVIFTCDYCCDCEESREVSKGEIRTAVEDIYTQMDQLDQMPQQQQKEELTELQQTAVKLHEIATPLSASMELRCDDLLFILNHMLGPE